MKFLHTLGWAMIWAALCLMIVVFITSPACSQKRAPQNDSSFPAFTHQQNHVTKRLIADETWVHENAKSISVITTNGTVYALIMKQYTSFQRMSRSNKKQKNGEYKYTFNYTKEDFCRLQMRF
jgi:hypothetical protein